MPSKKKPRSTPIGKLWWPKKMDLNLVEFMSTRRCIWDFNHPDYLDRNLTEAAYREFALKYKNDLTVGAVRHRWTNIRSVFSSNLRKIFWHKKVTKKDYTPAWHLWKSCTYMLDANIERRNRPRKNQKKKLDDDLQGYKESNNDEIMNFDDSFDDIASPNGSILNEDLGTGESFNVGSTNDVNNSSSKGIKPEENELMIACDKVLDSLSNILNPIKSESANKYEIGANFQQIGKFVIERLSKMKTFDAECATQKIMNVLVLYNEFNPNNPNNIHT